MENIGIIKEILLFLGGALSSFLVYFVSNKKNKISETQIVIDSLTSQLTKALERIDLIEAEDDAVRKDYDLQIKEFNEQIIKLRELLFEDKKMIEKLKNNLLFLESAHFQMPFPQWLKGLDGKMIKINQEYEKVFLKPLGFTGEDYIGNTDVDIWGEEVANQFAQNDLLAKSSYKYWRGKEKIHGIIYDIVKYPVFIGNSIIGIAGIAFTIND